MKIFYRRSAISQSMDLFIIIAAVLGVGGVVTAAVYGLAGSAATNSSIQVVQVQASGGAAAASTTISSFSVTLKNTGSSTITGTMSIILGGTAQGSPNPTVNLLIGSQGGTWNISSAGIGKVLRLTSGTAISLTPGAQVAISASGINAQLNGVGWNIGSAYTVTISVGGAQTAISVTA